MFSCRRAGKTEISRCYTQYQRSYYIIIIIDGSAAPRGAGGQRTTPCGSGRNECNAANPGPPSLPLSDASAANQCTVHGRVTRLHGRRWLRVRGAAGNAVASAFPRFFSSFFYLY